MKLVVLKEVFSILRLPPHSPLPRDICKSVFSSISWSTSETSIVLESRLVENNFEKCNSGWRSIKVDGVLDFSMTGVLSSIAGPLAQSQISIFAVSTFDTDYILVKEEQLTLALDTLRKTGFEIY